MYIQIYRNEINIFIFFFKYMLTAIHLNLWFCFEYIGRLNSCA